MLCCIGCTNSEDNDKTIGGMDMNFDAPISVRETFYWADDVYRGTLIHKECDDDKRLVNVTVKVSFSFKGIFTPGETVEDIVFDYLPKSVNGKYGNHLETGEEYLFMTYNERPINSLYSIIKVNHNGTLSYYYDFAPEADLYKKCYTNSKKYTHYDNLVYDMFDMDLLNDCFGDSIRLIDRDLSPVNNIDLGKLFLLSDKVYFGEIIEYTKINNRSPRSIVDGVDLVDVDLYKIKVQVTSSVKGKCTEGGIIEDVILVDKSCGDIALALKKKMEWCITSHSGLPAMFISASGLIDCYDEVVNLNAESEGFCSQTIKLKRVRAPENKLLEKY